MTPREASARAGLPLDGDLLDDVLAVLRLRGELALESEVRLADDVRVALLELDSPTGDRWEVRLDDRAVALVVLDPGDYDGRPTLSELEVLR